MPVNYKRCKMGDLPGDIPRREKAAMLEGKHPDRKRAKSFKKDFVKKATRRLRRMREEHPDDCVGYCCMDTSLEDANWGTWEG